MDVNETNVNRKMARNTIGMTAGYKKEKEDNECPGMLEWIKIGIVEL